MKITKIGDIWSTLDSDDTVSKYISGDFSLIFGCIWTDIPKPLFGYVGVDNHCVANRAQQLL